jgi:hypothetical protein
VSVTRVKRTYNLPERTVRLVRDLAVDSGLAETQDGVVELAVDELARHLREAEEGDAWAEAAEDAAFAAEAAAIERVHDSTTPAPPTRTQGAARMRQSTDSWRAW